MKILNVTLVLTGFLSAPALGNTCSDFAKTQPDITQVMAAFATGTVDEMRLHLSRLQLQEVTQEQALQMAEAMTVRFENANFLRNYINAHYGVYNGSMAAETIDLVLSLLVEKRVPPSAQLANLAARVAENILPQFPQAGPRPLPETEIVDRRHFFNLLGDKRVYETSTMVDTNYTIGIRQTLSRLTLEY